jgi:hypothetical protein
MAQWLPGKSTVAEFGNLRPGMLEHTCSMTRLRWISVERCSWMTQGRQQTERSNFRIYIINDVFFVNVKDPELL